MGGSRFLLALGGLAAVAAPLAAAGPSQRAPQAQVQRGLAFARVHCSGCHGVEANRLSPNPEAPPFEYVVSKDGLTPETLTYWLRHSHNFPEIMNFEIADDQVDALAAYMLTLVAAPADRTHARPPGKGKRRPG
ncbi:MAG: cytochrome c [Novosphingobium sp.]